MGTSLKGKNWLQEEANSPRGSEFFPLRAVPNGIENQGAQWLSGRVFDSRPRGRGFEPHRRHCVVVLEQDTFILA